VNFIPGFGHRSTSVAAAVDVAAIAIDGSGTIGVRKRDMFPILQVNPWSGCTTGIAVVIVAVGCSHTSTKLFHPHGSQRRGSFECFRVSTVL
jgi:hypothetical protein